MPSPSSSSPKATTIGALARAAEVGVETVRFYEREGLLVQPRRLGRSLRHYAPEAVSQVQFIRRAKVLGFSLEEIRDLLTLRSQPGNPCAAVRQQALTKLHVIDDKLQELQGLRDALVLLVDACAGDVATDDCSILAALQGEGRPHLSSAPPPPSPSTTRGARHGR